MEIVQRPLKRVDVTVEHEVEKYQESNRADNLYLEVFRDVVDSVDILESVVDVHIRFEVIRSYLEIGCVGISYLLRLLKEHVVQSGVPINVAVTFGRKAAAPNTVDEIDGFGVVLAHQRLKLTVTNNLEDGSPQEIPLLNQPFVIILLVNFIGIILAEIEQIIHITIAWVCETASLDSHLFQDFCGQRYRHHRVVRQDQVI